MLVVAFPVWYGWEKRSAGKRVAVHFLLKNKHFFLFTQVKLRARCRHGIN